MTAVSWPPRRRATYPPRLFVASAAIYGALLALDSISTVDAMRIFGPSIEVNPIVAAGIAAFGINRAIWGLHVVAFVPGLWLAARRPRFVWLAIAVYGVVVASNVYQLMSLP